MPNSLVVGCLPGHTNYELERFKSSFARSETVRDPACFLAAVSPHSEGGRRREGMGLEFKAAVEDADGIGGRTNDSLVDPKANGEGDSKEDRGGSPDADTWAARRDIVSVVDTNGRSRGLRGFDPMALNRCSCDGCCTGEGVHTHMHTHTKKKRGEQMSK